jgi:hypothetical protein
MLMHEALHLLIWCTLINYAILTIWFVLFVFAHEWLYRLHSRWFKLSVETFDTLNYSGMGIYKIGILLFNLVPLIALHLI